jgi:hypothetical protein
MLVRGISFILDDPSSAALVFVFIQGCPASASSPAALSMLPNSTITLCPRSAEPPLPAFTSRWQEKSLNLVE